MAETVFRRPGWITAHVFNPLVKGLARLGLPSAGAHVLAVRGRKSGEVRTTPVNPFELEGKTYLLAPRGTTQWARNLRAAGEGELRVRGKARRFRAAEVDDVDKLPLLRLYLDRWAWEAKDFLEADKDASDEQLREIAPRHPAFLLTFED
jgi:deazaflavin-dependent oxidoreductase (nitroreductase family)